MHYRMLALTCVTCLLPLLDNEQYVTLDGTGTVPDAPRSMAVTHSRAHDEHNEVRIHAQCLRCTHCGKAFAASNDPVKALPGHRLYPSSTRFIDVFEHDGHPYCADDHKALFSVGSTHSQPAASPFAADLEAAERAGRPSALDVSSPAALSVRFHPALRHPDPPAHAPTVAIATSSTAGSASAADDADGPAG